MTPTPALRRRGVRRVYAVDVAAATLAVASLATVPITGPSVQSAGWTALTAALALALIAGRGGYRFRLSVTPFDHLGKVAAGTALSTVIVIAARVLFADGPAIADEAVRSWVWLTAVLVLGRMAVAIRARRSPGRNTLIVGAGQVGRTVARRLLERPELGLRPVGFLDKDPRYDLSEEDPPVLGASWHLEEVIVRQGVEHVIVTFSTAPHGVLLSLVRRCRALGIEVSLVPRLFEEVSERVTVEHLGSVALLRVERADVRGWQFGIKYAIDRVVAAVALLVLLPVFVVLAILVRTSSPGPVFFRQPRIGLDGAEFEILKFRTMRVALGAPEADAGWAARALGREDVTVAAVAPARRTSIGSFLRRYSLDELPQLLNVLKGDMALVGPRPERTGYVNDFQDHIYRYGDRHRVKSGVTGWAQVQGLRGATSLQERVEWDNYYVENWSALLDLKILVLTLPAVLAGSEER